MQTSEQAGSTGYLQCYELCIQQAWHAGMIAVDVCKMAASPLHLLMYVHDCLLRACYSRASDRCLLFSLWTCPSCSGFWSHPSESGQSIRTQDQLTAVVAEFSGFKTRVLRTAYGQSMCQRVGTALSACYVLIGKQCTGVKCACCWLASDAAG